MRGKLPVVALSFISIKQLPFVVMRQVKLLVELVVSSCVIVVSALLPLGAVILCDPK